MSVVLDSWAVLRYLEDAVPAAQQVSGLLADQRPAMSWVNVGEVFYVVRRSHGEKVAMDAIRDLRDVVDCLLPDERLVIDAARVKSEHRMAYADAFAAATAIARGATLWTGDPELLVEGAPWRWLDLRPSG